MSLSSFPPFIVAELLHVCEAFSFVILLDNFDMVLVVVPENARQLNDVYSCKVKFKILALLIVGERVLVVMA